MNTPATPSPDAIDVDSTIVDDHEPTLAALAVVPQTSALIRPAADLDDIEEAFGAYVALTRKILTGDDYQGIGNKQFIKKTGWRKLATAMGVSFRNLGHTHTVDADGRIVRSEFDSQAIAPNGRYMDGYGACSIWDRCTEHWPNCKPGCTKHCGGRAGGCDGFNHFSKPEHDVPATAETRAKNRAASDLFGLGEVSAEEVDDQDPTTKIASRDTIDAVSAAAKAAKKAGVGGIGYPVILGTPIVEVFEEDGEKMRRTLITEAQAGELLARLENAVLALHADAENAKPAGEPAPGPVPAAEPEGGSDDAETPTVPAATVASDSPAPPLDAAGTPAAAAVEDDASGEGGPLVGVPLPAASTDLPVDRAAMLAADPSSPGEHSRFAQLTVKLADGDADLAKKAREALCSILTNGLVASGKELTSTEIRLGMRACKLLESGDLVFVVDDGETEPAAWVPGEAFPDPADATLWGSIPESGDGAAGARFIRDLCALTGAEIEGE